MNRTSPRLVPHCRQAGCAAPPLPLPCHARCSALHNARRRPAAQQLCQRCAIATRRMCAPPPCLLLHGSHSSFDQVRLQGHAGPSHCRSSRHCQTRAQQLCSLRRGRLHAVQRQRLPHWRDTHLRWPLTMARRSAVTMTSMTLQSNSNAGSVGSLEASTTWVPCSNW